MKPHLRLQWCIGQITAEFLARMEQVLQLYHQAYDAAYPVVCFDERPCQLLDQVTDPLLMQPGKPFKKGNDGAARRYERQGTCSLLVAFEPLTGQRWVETSPTRKGEDYTRFMQALAKAYPDAVKIPLVQDNRRAAPLNTHASISICRPSKPCNWPTDLSGYTPPKKPPDGPPLRLNMVELELSALSRICLQRRIASMEQLDQQIQALVKERNQAKTSVDWQFNVETARNKLKRHYQKVNSKN